MLYLGFNKKLCNQQSNYKVYRYCKYQKKYSASHTFTFNLQWLRQSKNAYAVDFGTTFFIYQVIKSNVWYFFNM